MNAFVDQRPAEPQVLLRPWRLPAASLRFAPQRLRRFVRQRCQAEGHGIFGFPAVELAARAWAGTKTDRTLHARFVFRRVLGEWAARQSSLASADSIVAPSCAARAVFAAAPKAKKILLLDMPGLRTLHEDLDLAAALNASSAYLHRYRAPDWVLVNQEVEWQLADEIHVRGRFVRDLLMARGVPAQKIHFLSERSELPVGRKTRAEGAPVRVLLAGLASARYGTHELLSALQDRPWLEIFARSGEGCEPAAFVSHPRVFAATKESIAEVDAVIVPSFCETYLPELRLAKASGIPVIATVRGSAHMPASELFAELTPTLEHSLPLALDRLRSASLVH